MRNFAAGNWKAALADLERCERIIPGIPEMIRLRGQAFYKLERWNEAIPLLRVGSSNETERLMLADALRQIGNHRESNEVLMAPLTQGGLAAQALLIRAANHAELHEYSAVTELLRIRVIENPILDATRKQEYYLLAQAYEQTDRIADAIHHLKLNTAS